MRTRIYMDHVPAHWGLGALIRDNTGEIVRVVEMDRAEGWVTVEPLIEFDRSPRGCVNGIAISLVLWVLAGIPFYLLVLR